VAQETVLIVEDEENIQIAVKYNLQKEGYRVETAADGESGLELARSISPQLVILDVMLPGMNGLEVCRSIRRDATVPILMLTARGEEIDRVLGLEIGADDYLVKPFGMRELIARVKALIRRSTVAAASPSQPAARVLRSGDLEINVDSHVAMLRGKTLELKPKEFELLTLLVENKGRVFTREQVLDRLWGIDFIGDIRTVDVHIRWLREKIETDDAKPERIITVRGVGYRFEG